MRPATAIAITLLAGLLGCEGTRFHPRDVVVIVMDTTRRDRLGIYGGDHEVSPRIDAFAGDCEVYLRAWATASWTLPSHASLLTGKYVTAHGAHNRPDLDGDSLGDNPPRLSEEEVTLAELLAQRGYHTAAFAGAGWLDPEFGLLQGYSIQDARNLRDISAQEITDRASRWIDTVPAGEPLHLLVNYFDPHGPYDPPDAFNTSPEGRSEVKPLGPKIPWEEMNPEQQSGLRERISQWKRVMMARYEGEIRYTDHHVGRLLDKLRQAGRYEGALIILVSDHGEAFLEHGARGHGAWLYEPLIRIPFLVHRPGGRNRGSRITAPVSLVDVLPIVAEETGLPLPPGIDGLPVGKRELVLAEETPSVVFKNHDRKLDRDLVAAVRWPFKLILNQPGDKELYRLEEDPDEKENLADGGREAELERLLRAEVASLVPPASVAPARPMTPESRERLRSLGYLE